MKTISGLLLLLFYSATTSAQGTSCSSPYDLVLDDVCRDYTISSTTGTALYCTDVAYTTTGRITIFSFTPSASCVLINMTVSGDQPTEVLLYSGCTGGGGLQSQQPTSSMCFNTGQGLWAPAETLILTAGHTYYLRVWTPGTGTINMCAKNYDPPNDDCTGSTPIGPGPLSDNNACAKPGPGVVASQLCAASLENTVFYAYTVQNTGVSSITIDNISCNNSNNDNNNGMQIGFFTGNCVALSPLSCTTTSGQNVSASTNSLPAGTQVYVAIDGFAGSNCTYTISANNAIPLAVYLKYFSGWKTMASNILKWTTMYESNNSYFEIQRSTDGMQFSSIGRIPGAMDSYTDKTYSFEDNTPPVKAFYRIMSVDIDRNKKFSKTISIIRNESPYVKLEFENPVQYLEKIAVKTNFTGKVNIAILNMNGQIVYKTDLSCNKGLNYIHRNFDDLANGKYIITVMYNEEKISKSFIKLNTGVNYHQ